MYDPPGEADKLPIVSRSTTSSDVLRADADDVCSPNTIPSTVTGDQSQERFLNLRAEIGIKPLLFVNFIIMCIYSYICEVLMSNS